MDIPREQVTKAVESYNRYRSPEAEAKLIDMQNGYLVVEFKGPFCASCSLYDWFDDFIYELAEITGIKAEIEKVDKAGPESFRVKYILRHA